MQAAQHPLVHAGTGHSTGGFVSEELTESGFCKHCLEPVGRKQLCTTILTGHRCCKALTEDNEHTTDFGKWTLYVFFCYNSKNITTISDSNKVLHTVNENSLFKLISLASI